jgi:Uma2 family endonuclease
MAEPARVWTLDDFLDWERQEERYEFIDGIIRAMVGGTLDHKTIIDNVCRALRQQLRNTGCRAFSDGVKVMAGDELLYPDVSVTCKGVNPRADTVPDPVLIVEVLSRPAADLDRGRKWQAYQQIASLAYYMMIDQTKPRVELFSRHGQAWDYRTITGGDVGFSLAQLDCTLTLDAIYEDTSLAP